MYGQQSIVQRCCQRWELLVKQKQISADIKTAFVRFKFVVISDK